MERSQSGRVGVSKRLVQGSQRKMATKPPFVFTKARSQGASVGFLEQVCSISGARLCTLSCSSVVSSRPSAFVPSMTRDRGVSAPVRSVGLKLCPLADLAAKRAVGAWAAVAVFADSYLLWLRFAVCCLCSVAKAEMCAVVAATV